MIEDTIHLIHLGPEDGPTWNQAQAAVTSFNRMGHGCALWCGDDIRLLLGAARVNQIIKDYPTYAGASNALRLLVIWYNGGVYADTDVICHKPINSLLKHKAFGAIQDEQGRICNAFFGAEQGSPWIGWQVDRMDRYKGVAAFWGVDLMSEAPRDEVTLIDPKLCYPYSWTTPMEDRKIYPETLVEHKWAGSWVKCES